MIEQTIKELADKKNLASYLMEAAFEEVMQGKASPAHIAAFLMGLRLKGETVDEITCGAKIMRKYAAKLSIDNNRILDTCGTGGDGAHTFNISTISAIVVAGAGIKVAKHGNKAVSSQCGSADLLKSLGVNIEAEIKIVERCIKEVGFGFLFAPIFHPAMKNVSAVRKELGIRTIFNILGPLTNPAGAQYQLLGVFNGALAQTMAEVLKNLGANHVVVVCGDDGLDEVTTTTYTQVCEFKNGKITSYKISPEDVGLKKAKIDDLRGGDIALNTKICLDILQGKPGPKTDAILLNAGCAIYAADGAGDIQQGIEIARESINSEKAINLLNKIIEYTNAFV